MSSPATAVQLHADLDLVRACLGGDRRSLADFDRQLRQVIAPVCARFDVHRSDSADLHQRLLLRLLIDVPGRPAQLRSYRGQGSLVAWLRICATRELLGELRRRRPASADFVAYTRSLGDAADPESIALGEERRRRLAAALHDGIAGLEPRLRASLRAIVDGEATRELAARYGVHRVTITRWAAQARATLRARVVGDDVEGSATDVAELAW
jgi:RNA polymerase sigma-70 factor